MLDHFAGCVSLMSLSRVQLERVLRLYVDLRLLCICPSEILALRAVLWGASLQGLFVVARSSKATDFYEHNPSCLVNRARLQCGLSSIPPSRMINPALLKRLLAHGRLISRRHCGTEVAELLGRLLSSLSRLLEELLNVLGSALLCESQASAQLLHRRLKDATHHSHFSINVTGEYAYMRLLSLMKMKQRPVAAEESTAFFEGALLSPPLADPSEVENSSCTEKTECCSPNVETHCWCDGPEGGDMICCEGCEVWFHCSCIGLVKKTISSLTDHSFFCVACTEVEQGKKYEYSWSSKYVTRKLISC